MGTDRFDADRKIARGLGQSSATTEFLKDLEFSCRKPFMGLIRSTVDQACRQTRSKIGADIALAFMNPVDGFDELLRSRLFVEITGGTGFLGSYLLKDLLQKTDVSVCCLV